MELLGGFPVETLGDQLEGAGIGRHLHRHVYGVVKSDQVSAHAQPNKRIKSALSNLGFLIN